MINLQNFKDDILEEGLLLPSIIKYQIPESDNLFKQDGALCGIIKIIKT